MHNSATQTMECSLLYTYLTNQSSNLPPDRSCTFSGQGEEHVPDVFCVLKIAANRLDIPVSLSVVLLRMSLIKVKVYRHIFLCRTCKFANSCTSTRRESKEWRGQICGRTSTDTSVKQKIGSMDQRIRFAGSPA
jgi:hypothetical protein